MGKDIEVNFVRVHHLWGSALAFGHHLVYGSFAGACYGLVGRDHDALDAVALAQRLQGQDHLNGGAIGVGNDFVACGEFFGIDFGHHQLFAGVHSPGGGVVNDYRAYFRKLRRPFQGGAASCGEDGDVWA